MPPPTVRERPGQRRDAGRAPFRAPRGRDGLAAGAGGVDRLDVGPRGPCGRARGRGRPAARAGGAQRAAGPLRPGCGSGAGASGGVEVRVRVPTLLAACTGPRGHRAARRSGGRSGEAPAARARARRWSSCWVRSGGPAGRARAAAGAGGGLRRGARRARRPTPGRWRSRPARTLARARASRCRAGPARGHASTSRTGRCGCGSPAVAAARPGRRARGRVRGGGGALVSARVRRRRGLVASALTSVAGWLVEPAPAIAASRRPRRPRTAPRPVVAVAGLRRGVGVTTVARASARLWPGAIPGRLRGHLRRRRRRSRSGCPRRPAGTAHRAARPGRVRACGRLCLVEDADPAA